MAVRALRGAVQVEANRPELIHAGAAQLLAAVLAENGLETDALISVIFTATPDLTADFPAYGVRQVGVTDVPLLCARELDVAGAMPRVLRILAHVETDLPRAQCRHCYLGAAAALRPDLTGG